MIIVMCSAADWPNIDLKDFAYPVGGGGTGGQPACVPACAVSWGVNPWPGCATDATAESDIITSCSQNGSGGSGGRIDIDSCDGYQFEILAPEGDGPAAGLVYDPSGATISRYDISNCQTATPQGQCAYSGGGCDAAEVDV
ncbi:hypothetical protein GE09DRAFT_1053790 [Coniochaeta sp. 2T2.1]|nr:hypothetical protein GE09DRAFT_1053790 [Coniochaeta sp. 2T2.1]